MVFIFWFVTAQSILLFPQMQKTEFFSICWCALCF